MQLFVGLYKMCLYSVLTKAMHFYNVSSDVDVIVSITSLKVRVTIRRALGGTVPLFQALSRFFIQSVSIARNTAFKRLSR